MIHEHELPAPPPDRGLPDHRLRREELLMRIDPDEKHMSLGRLWGLPLGVATGVATLGVTAVAVFGGGTSKSTVTMPIGPGASLASSSTSPGLTAPTTPGPQIDPTAPVITTGGGRQLTADRVAKILASCLGSDASRFHAVIAVSTAIATTDEDGYVIAKNDGGKFAECSAHGDVGRPGDGGGADINLLPTQAGGAVQMFSGGTDFNTPGTDGTPTSYLVINSGHVSSAVVKVTITYGTERKQYPAILEGGAYYLSVSTPYHKNDSHPPVGWVHAFDASGK